MTLKRLAVALFLLSLAGGPAHAWKPKWVKKRPVRAAEYIGIGSISKRAGPEYAQTARTRALKDLTSDIAVTVRSEFIETVVERSGLTETDVRSEVRASAKAVLSGHDCSETWENRKSYWVLCRLPKAVHAANEGRRLERAKRLTLDLYVKAVRDEGAGRLARALKWYVQALLPIQDFPGRPIEVELEGKKILLGNAVYTSLQDLLTRIELEADSEKITAIAGRRLKFGAAVTALSGNKTVNGLTLRCTFLRGAGKVIGTVVTKGGGTATCDVLKVGSDENIQILEVRLDPLDLAKGSDTSLILKETLRNLTSPSVKITLEVHGLPIHVDAVEINLDEELQTPHIAHLLREALTGRGYLVVEKSSGAQLLIALDAHSRKGTITHGIASTYVNATITVTDPISGEEIYQAVLKDIKGMHLDHREAGLKAFESATRRVEKDILPSLLDRIGKWEQR